VSFPAAAITPSCIASGFAPLLDLAAEPDAGTAVTVVAGPFQFTDRRAALDNGASAIMSALGVRGKARCQE
jgi:hypothetical protein